MLKKLPTQVRWASPETFEFVKRQILQYDARYFSYEDSVSYYVEVDLVFPDEVKNRLRK